MTMEPQTPPGPSSTGTDPRTWAIVVWVLLLLGYLTFVTVIVSVVMAYVKRGDLVGTPFESHMTSAIRTFWISLIAGVIGAVLTVIGIGFLILAAVIVWNLYRIIRGLIRAIDGRPIDDPTGYL